VSYAFVYVTDATRARGRTLAANHYLGKLGVSPQHPGVNPATDHAKSSVTQVMIPLRKRVGRTVGACSSAKAFALRSVASSRATSMQLGSVVDGTSAISERVGVAVDGGRAAKVRVKHLRSLGEVALLHQVDHALHGFSLIDRVGDHAFEASA
jgi:hypothetical protein